MEEKLARGTIRHIILFKLYEGTDSQKEAKAVSLLKALGEGNEEILEWRIARSIDTRKGIIVIENGLFKNEEAYERFRKSDKHSEIVKFMSQIADWTVGDYIDG